MCVLSKKMRNHFFLKKRIFIISEENELSIQTELTTRRH